MTWAHLLLYGVAAWTAIGLVGSFVSGITRSNWPKARRGLRWIAIVWIVYLSALLLVSRMAPERSFARGTAQCFGAMCYTVAEVQEMVGYAGRGQAGGRLLRVVMRVSNRGTAGSQKDGRVRAYLRDGRGRRWYALPGVGGIPLTASVSSGASVLSEPVYAIPADAHDLDLILTHGVWQPGRLVIGDGDSLLHRPVVMRLAEPANLQQSAP